MSDDWLSAHTQNILDQPLRDGYRMFLKLCQELEADTRTVHREAQLVLGVLNSKRAKGSGSISPRPLERRWYESLSLGEPDYSVYDGDDYLGEMWASWAFYARKYLRSVRDKGFLAAFQPGTRVLDMGCGCGLTTVALTQIIPHSQTIATNMGASRQAEFCRRLAAIHGFEIAGTLTDAALVLDGRVDVVFASEYFEHVPEPVEHLEEVLSLDPQMIIVANTFDRPSVGHFDTTGYHVRGEKVPNRSVTPAFHAVLRGNGFTKLETGFWNGRPACWRRKLLCATLDIAMNLSIGLPLS